MQPQVVFGISVLLGFVQGAAYFIPIVLLPLLLVTHALVFRILIGTTAVGQQRGHSAV